MNKKLLQFLDDVCVHIKFKEIHKEIRDELTHHIEDLKNEYLKQGNNEETALDMAIDAMGNRDDIGKKLNKQHKPQTEWSLIVLTGIIVIIGGIVMYLSNNQETNYFQRHLLSIGTGIVILISLYFLDYTKLKKKSLLIYFIPFILFAITLFQNVPVNGQRYLLFGNFSISSEYIKLFFLIAFVGFLDNVRGKGFSGFIALLGLAIFSLIPLVIFNSFSQVFILLLVYTVLFISAISKNHFGENRKKYFLTLTGVGVTITAFISFYILSSSYRFQRITTFLTKGKSDPTGAGWIYVMVDKWLKASDFIGKMPKTIDGSSINETFPDVINDYALVNIIANLGWIVGIGLILVILLFIIRLFITNKKIKNQYGFYLSLGASIVLSAQFVISILINFGLLPMMSTNLPFISYGATGYLVNMALVGIILSIWRRNNLLKASTYNPETIKKKFIEYTDGKLIINLK